MQIMEQAFVQLAECAVDMPKRLTMSDDQRAGWTALMPSRLLGSGAFGMKIVTTFDENPSKYGVPTIMGAILYMDQETGRVLSIMDGGFITAMRTGAVSGLKPAARTAAVLRGGIRIRRPVRRPSRPARTTRREVSGTSDPFAPDSPFP